MKTNSNATNFLLAVIATVTFISTYYLLLPVLPLRMVDLGASEFEVGLIMGIFSASSLFFRPVIGQLADAYGRRKMILFVVASYLGTPVFYYFAGQSLATFVGAQILYGLTIGAFTTAVVTYIADIAPDHLMVKYIGFHSIAIISAKELAPALGWKLWYRVDFTTIVFLTVILAVVAFLAVLLLTEKPSDSVKLPRVPFRQTLARPSTVIPTLTLFCGMVSFGGITVMLPLFAQSLSLGDVSWFFVVHFVAVLLTRVVTGRIPNSYLYQLVLVSLALIALSLFGISFVQNSWQLAVVAVLFGIGYGAVYPALSAIVALNTPMHFRGAALGIYTMSFDLGVTAGAIVAGSSTFWGFAAVYRCLSLFPVAGFVYYYFHGKKVSLH